MRIGIDVDDTITNSYIDITKRISEVYGINQEDLINEGITYEEIMADNERFPNYPDFVKNNFESIMKDVTIKKDVCEVINKLRDDGHEIFIVTARKESEYGFPYAYTYEYLVRKDILFDKIIVEPVDKGTVCKNNNIDILIDDNVINCESAKDSNIPCLLFDNTFNKDNNTFRRVNSWKEVYDVINEIKNA